MTKAFLISFFGYPARVARELETTRSVVHSWPEALSDSALGRIARLRPDVLRAWWDQEVKPLRERGS